jgi:L-ascorbate metabolism protein UlaG (beta-lactamase superfamily)
LGTASVKEAGPAIAPSDPGPIDVVLLIHDHHDDNLDAAGRALLPSAGVVVTTAAGAKRTRGGGTSAKAERAIERELAGAPDDVRQMIRWLPIGVPTELND